MIIGIDAGALCIKEKRLRVGVFTLVRNLVIGLARVRNTDTVRLYAFDSIDQDISDEFPGNVEIRVLPRFLFSTLQMAFSCIFDPCDVFMGTGQTIALGARHPVGWIYDLGFLEHPECYPHSMNQLAFITKTVVSRSEKIITISEYVKKEIVKRFRVDPEKIYVCYPGIQRQKLIAKNTMVKDRPYFLFVGAFKPGKNIPFLLRSFSKAVRRGLQSDLILVGSDRWMNENIQGIIARERLNSRVTVKGYIDEKSLQELYTGAKATLIPSLVEGFGFPAVESFHCGTPVIGSTAGSLPEVIGNGGVCIDPWDEEGFVQVLLQFEKTDVRGAYKKGIQAQVEKFTQEKFAAHVSDVIDLI